MYDISKGRYPVIFASVLCDNANERKESLCGMQVCKSISLTLHPKLSMVLCDRRAGKVVSRCTVRPSGHVFEERHPRPALQRCNPGPNKVCERCTAMGLKDCTYEPRKKRGTGRTLRMGEACKYCRSAIPQLVDVGQGY